MQGSTKTSVRICVLGSGSSGNSTFVATEKVRVLFDAGINCKQIHERLSAVGEDASELDAVVVSHEHSDHVRGIEVLAKKTGVPVYFTEPTADTLEWNKVKPTIEFFEAGRRFSIGDLEIDTFSISHDAVDPVGFCVRCEGVKLAIATDLGYMSDSVRYHLRGSDFLVLESNHDLEMLRVGPYPWMVKQRVLSRDGHLSNHAAAEFLANDWDRRAQTIVLAHLSGNNNHPALAQMDSQRAIDKVGAAGTELLIASQEKPTAVFRY